MLRLIGVLIGLPILAVAASFAGSNLRPVTLELFPLPYSVEAPLALVVYAAVVLGFIVGAVVAWIGAGRLRRRAHANETAARRARAERDGLKDRASRDATNALERPREPAPRALAGGGRG